MRIQSIRTSGHSHAFLHRGYFLGSSEKKRFFWIWIEEASLRGVLCCAVCVCSAVSQSSRTGKNRCALFVSAGV
jgi:hypothetical protein